MKKRALLCTNFSPGFHNILAGTKEEILSIFDGHFEFAEVTDECTSKSMDELRGYDCIMFYCAALWSAGPDSDFFANLIDYLANGGSAIVLHFMSPGHMADEGAQVFGGRFVMHPPYKRCKVVPGSKKHPITEGIKPFEIDDEMHQLFTEEFLDKTVLLDCVNDECSSRAGGVIPHRDIYAKNSGVLVPLAWCHEFGKGRIIYSCPGHNAESFKVEEYRKFLVRCGKWLVEEL